MRSLATAIETYSMDCNIYPAWGIGRPGPGRVRTFNWDIAQGRGNRSGVADLPSFLVNDRPSSGGSFSTLCDAVNFIGLGGFPIRPLPIGARFKYIASYPVDRYCADRGATYVYWSTFPGEPNIKVLYRETPVGGVGWITVSPGPDGDYDVSGSYHVYNPAVPQPSIQLLTGTNAKGASLTYDPTNGLISDGDIWRVKM